MALEITKGKISFKGYGLSVPASDKIDKALAQIVETAAADFLQSALDDDETHVFFPWVDSNRQRKGNCKPLDLDISIGCGLAGDEYRCVTIRTSLEEILWFALESADDGSFYHELPPFISALRALADKLEAGHTAGKLLRGRA